MELFQETVANWEDWGRVYQSILAFTPLAKEIVARERLPFAPLEPLTPGTNAVFRSGPYVLKIYAPAESGLDASADCRVETAVGAYLSQAGLPCAAFVAQGEIADKYRFSYLISSYAEGQEAGSVLPAFPVSRKKEFACRLCGVLKRLNRPCGDLIPPINLLERAVENPRLGGLPVSLRESLCERARRLDLSHPVLVHGDLTGENVLLSPDGGLMLIDFGDCCLAPAWYELAPIVFELFRCDPVLLLEFRSCYGEAEFVERVLDSLCLHDFGASILQDFAQRENLPLEAFSTLERVGRWLQNRLS